MKGLRILLGIALAMSAICSTAMGATEDAAVCTWGGTPDNPTGTVSVPSGIRNTRSATPIPFTVTGDLAGPSPRCTGTMTLAGEFTVGSSCSVGISHAAVTGVPGVAGDLGVGVAYYVQGTLFDAGGHTAGVYEAQIFSAGGVESAQACQSSAGYRYGLHSTVVELYPLGL